jgi:phospholipase C
VLDNIDHVVLLMLENRSLDNVLGWLYADDAPARVIGADTTSVFHGLQGGNHSNEYGGRVIPVTSGTRGGTGYAWVDAQPLRVPGFDPGEEYEHVTQQLFGSPDHPTTTNPPTGTPAGMAGFAYDYDHSYETWDELDQVMECYTPAQLPILNGLARAYGVSDAWHSSVPTQTNPNRAFSLCGTSLGRVNNTWDAVEQFDTHTIWNALPEGTSWGIYYHDIWQAGQCYTQYTFPRCNDARADGEVEPIATFYEKARAGALPRFTYLEPKWGYGLGKPDGSGFYCGDLLGKVYGSQGNDYHPPTWVGPGEAFVNQVYSALIADPVAWQRTLLIITFDEHGGTYDHVDPGWGAVPPDADRGPDGFGFDRYGVRVPTLLVSPWVPAGTVFRSPDPKTPFDHTSLISTILSWCGVEPATAGLGARAATAPTFGDALVGEARSDVPTFALPEGYADQGKDCWIGGDAQQQPVGVMRSLVSRSGSIEELLAKVKTLANGEPA